VIHKSFKRYLRPKKGLTVVADCSGIIGTTFKYSPLCVQTYAEDFLQPLYDCLELNDDVANLNVACTLGIFCALGKELLVPHYQKILQVLKHVFDTGVLEETKDNAVSAIAKMAYTQPDKMPLSLVVPNIMNALPFKGDLKENKTAVKMIIHFLESNAQALNGQEEKAIVVLIDAIVNWNKYSLKEKYVKACGVMLKALGNTNEQLKKIIETNAAKLQEKDFAFVVQAMS